MAVLLIVGAALTVALVSRRAEATQITLSGTILSATTGQPIPNVKVTISQNTDLDANGKYDALVATTSAQGTFSVVVTNMPSLYWDVFAVVTGYESLGHEAVYRPSVDGTQGTTTTLKMTPSLAERLVGVTVLDAPSGNTVPGVKVSLHGRKGTPLGVTDSNGTCTVGLPTTTTSGYFVIARPSDRNESVFAQIPTQAPISVVLYGGLAGRKFAGTMKDGSGTAIAAPSYRLAFFLRDSGFAAIASTEPTSGKYDVNLPNGTFDAVLVANGTCCIAEVSISASTSTTLDLTFQEYGAQGGISGRLADGDEGYLQGITASVARVALGRSIACAQTSSDAEGWFVFDGLPNGEYALSFSAHGDVRSGELEVIIANGADVDVGTIVPGLTEIVPGQSSAASGSGTLGGSVVDDTGAPVVGARVCACQPGKVVLLSSNESGTGGSFSLPGLADGNYELSVFPVRPSGGGVLVNLGGITAATVASGQGTAGSLVLYRSHGLVVQAFSVDGEDEATVLPGATVVVRNSSNEVVATKTTSDSGMAVFGGLAEASFTVTVSKSGLGSEAATLDIAAGRSLDLSPTFKFCSHTFYLSSD